MKDKLVDTFPEVSGASVRKGCISECESEMPDEYTDVTNGHTLRRESVMWDYVSWTLPAGANVWNHIAGWSSRPWGQYTTVAKPASLVPLLQIGIHQDTIDRMIDSVPHQRFCMSPPVWYCLGTRPGSPSLCSMLQKRVQFRSFVETTCVSMFMHYKEHKGGDIPKMTGK